MIVLCTTLYSQTTLSTKDFNNLLSLCTVYPRILNADGAKVAREIDSLRTPRLNHIIDALIETGNANTAMVSKKMLARPGHDELVLWYVIREVYYNKGNTAKTSRPDSVVAREVLNQTIDERWLLDNYYYRIHNGLGKLFNEADLSKTDIPLDSLGFHDQTERAICFFNICEALMGGRTMVLQLKQKFDVLLSFCNKLPTINGKKYFYFGDFDFPDFQWIGYDKEESYKERNLSNYYVLLLAHILAEVKVGDKQNAAVIYQNSILNEPKFFIYSTAKESLEMLYKGRH